MLRLIFALLCLSTYIQAQTIKGNVTSNGEALPFVNVYLKGTKKGAVSDENGNYHVTHVAPGTYRIVASFTGFKPKEQRITVSNTTLTVNFDLQESESLDEIVITGTLKAVSRLESAVPVEVYSPAFFKKNPTPNIFESLQNVNGVRPQINCNVCNTGDIHINGLEGPYTLVLIDGMPIVSGLSTVYGLSGIPNSLIEQIEIIKGPASSLYGSEAVGGLINIITKLPENAPRIFADSYVSGWGELNTDVGFKTKIGSKAHMLFGLNYFNYSNPIDNNNDNFTDLTLQDRISIFQKIDFKRDNHRTFSMAGRFLYEDRWGGELQWNKSFRGGSEVYGESIYTKRFEILGNYQLPTSENIHFQWSFTDHDQNSVYGNVHYLAQQRIGFGQLTWDKNFKHHDMLFGVAARYNFYNDNTPATQTADEVTIPSIFVQDEITLGDNHSLLLGSRWDYDKRHGSIFTPRMAYKWKPTDDAVFRVNAGTGFRVVNLFTEEHAALTGSRDVVIAEALNPERSYNVNVNVLKKLYSKSGHLLTFDASTWFTYFNNVIIPDYDTNPNQIIYDNLKGHAITKGVSLNVDATFSNGIKLLVGATLQDVSQTENGVAKRQILTEQFSGTWAISYKSYQYHLSFDYTGNIYGPMRLPLLGELDPRQAYSATWSIQNFQITFDGWKNFEMYTGIKNLLHWTPNRNNPFIISRAHDPFDKNVTFDSNGNAMVTDENPYALTFDPSYVYAPNQGRRLFFGLRYTLK